MRKPVLLIWTNAAILIVLFALMTQSLFLVSRIAHTKWARGQVEVLHQGQSDWRSVVEGTPVKTGDTLRTGSDGRAEFAWVDGTRWKLEPNTLLVIERAQLNSMRASERTQLRLETGKVWVRVVKHLGPNSSFEVQTPRAQASVKGTVWSIEVVGEQTRVGVLHGFVDVTASGQSYAQRVSPGFQAVAGQDSLELQSASPKDQAEFQAQSDLTHPELEVSVKLGQTSAMLSGQTETGDSLALGDEPVPVLGNGTFIARVALVKGHNEWKFTATDKHGETTSTCRAAEFDGQRATTSACR
jgi:hypothetical protein